MSLHLPEPHNYSWWCPLCRRYLEIGDDAIPCDSREDCVRTEEWGGSACGYIVCEYCRTPAVEKPI